LESKIWAIESAIANLDDARSQDSERIQRVAREIKTTNDTAAHDRKVLHALSRSISDLLRANQSLSGKNLELEKRLKALEQRPLHVPVLNSPVRAQPSESQVVRLKVPARVLLEKPTAPVPAPMMQYKGYHVEMTGAVDVIQPPLQSLPTPAQQITRIILPLPSTVSKPIPRADSAISPPAATMIHPARPQHAKTFSQATTQDDDHQSPISPIKSIIKQPPPEHQSPVKPSTRKSPRKVAKPPAPPNVEIFAPRQTRSQTKAFGEQESQAIKASMESLVRKVPATALRNVVSKQEVQTRPKSTAGGGRRAAGKVSGNGACKAKLEEKAQVQNVESKRKTADLAAEEEDGLAQIPAPKRRRRLI